MACKIVVEDFAPFSDTEAYISIGPSLANQTAIATCQYSIDDPSHVIIIWEEVVRCGGYCRLGHLHETGLAYSIGNNIFVEGGEKFWGAGKQPFIHGKNVFYNWRRHETRAEIWCNGKPYLLPWDEFESVGKPHVHETRLYFEARAGAAPRGWQLWFMVMDTGEKRYIRNHAGNPFVFNGRLFFSDFSGWPEVENRICWMEDP